MLLLIDMALSFSKKYIYFSFITYYPPKYNENMKFSQKVQPAGFEPAT